MSKYNRNATQPKTERIVVRVTETEKNKLTRIAFNQNKTISRVILESVKIISWFHLLGRNWAMVETNPTEPVRCNKHRIGQSNRIAFSFFGILWNCLILRKLKMSSRTINSKMVAWQLAYKNKFNQMCVQSLLIVFAMVSIRFVCTIS